MTFGRLMVRAMAAAKNDNELEEMLDFCSLYNNYFDCDLDDIKIETHPEPDDFEMFADHDNAKEELNNVNR